MKGVEAFKQYVRPVRGALADYRWEILACVTERNQAFAKMRFSGRHVAPFRGYPPTGKTIRWPGAVLFRFEARAIAELWVLGNLAGLDTSVQRNQQTWPIRGCPKVCGLLSDGKPCGKRESLRSAADRAR